ncbi:hypothetical protein MVEN_02363500 [Mycena venus]|uniref:Ubiquitin-like domain-containing protein n=1 Tax=Mycena venus TaxID=2733690 RepID=A0A8H6X362_9AGAR|nr:hypothetical protein MVEN_02363500 [Mycena venus]
MPVVAAAFTYGSFGDILDTARLAKRIIDVLRNGGGSVQRQNLISMLKGLCDDMASLATAFNDDLSSPEALALAAKLSAEVASCRLLVQQFSTKLATSRGVLRRILTVVSEERELAEWRTQVSERRDVLHSLVAALNSTQSREINQQLARIGSKVENIQTQVQNIGVDVRNVDLIISTYLSTEASRMGSHIHRLETEMNQRMGEQVMQRTSLHDVSDPVFFVVDPLGRPITIQLVHCDTFNDLDRILKAHLHDRPDAGSRYIQRGDYNIVSQEGVIMSPLQFARKVRPGSRFDMSILKRIASKPAGQKCPNCDHTNPDSADGSWIDCLNPACGGRYQISLQATGTEPEIEELYSPQIIAEQDNQQQAEEKPELFRLLRLVYMTAQSASSLLKQTFQGTNGTRKREVRPEVSRKRSQSESNTCASSKFEQPPPLMQLLGSKSDTVPFSVRISKKIPRSKCRIG